SAGPSGRRTWVTRNGGSTTNCSGSRAPRSRSSRTSWRSTWRRPKGDSTSGTPSATGAARPDPALHSAIRMSGHRVRVEHDVDDRGLAGSERALERRRQLVRALHVFAVPAERFRQTVVPCRREPRRDLAPVPVEADLRDPDLAPRGVVPDHERHRQAEACERLELEAVEPERAVPGDDDDLLGRLRGLDAERVRRPDAETAERTR